MLIGLMATVDHHGPGGAGAGIVAGFVGGRLDTILMRIVGLLPRPAHDRPRDHPGRRSCWTCIGARGGDVRRPGDADRDRGRDRHHQLGRDGPVIRSQVLSIKERTFVDRARVVGAGSGHIMRHHILPNVVNLIVAQAVLTFARRDVHRDDARVHRPRRPVRRLVGPDPQRRAVGRARRASAPGGTSSRRRVCVVLVVLAFTLVGNALDDILNPKASGDGDEPTRRAASAARASGRSQARRTRTRRCSWSRTWRSGSRCRTGP